MKLSVALIVLLAFSLASAELIDKAVCNVDYSVPYTVPVVNGVKAKLKQAHMLNRHGDRYFQNDAGCWPANPPLTWECSKSTFLAPADSLTNPTGTPELLFRINPLPGATAHPGNCLDGSLSDRGVSMLHDMGLKMRDIYMTKTGLLKDDVASASSEVLVRATNFPRTLMTAQRAITALYEGSPSKVPGMTPIVDVFFADNSMDIVYPGNALCPKFGTLTNLAKATPAYKAHIDKYATPLRANLSKALEMKVTDVDIGVIYDCSVIHFCNDKPIPAAFNPEMINAVQEENLWQVAYLHTYPNRTMYARLGTGLIVKEWISQMELAILGPHHPQVLATQTKPWRLAVPGPVVKDHKFFMYSCHDTNMFNFLLALDIFDNKWPAYTSNVVIELWQITDSAQPTPKDFAIRMLHDFKVVRIPKCSRPELCPWSEFVDIYADIIPSDDLAECAI